MKEKLSLTTMFKSFFSKFAWPLALIAITALICITNYSSDKWLTGWDTLHPEFNLPLHIYRSIFGVWREDQGLGTLAAHAHMSEIPRLLILGLLSLTVPLNAVRISFIFLCLILGSLGIYYFLRDGVFRNKSIITNAASFLGSLVYIFNLSTVQHFYVIFEMFAVQYAALGWLFLFVVKCLYEDKKRNWLILFILSFLSAPMAYASQLWFAYFGGLFLFVVTLLLIEKDKKAFVRKITKIGTVTLAANAFWLLPNLYFLLSGDSQVPMNAHINRTFSPESFLQNAAYGKIQDVAILKNFLFNWFIYNPDQKKFVDLLSIWRAHLENPAVLFIGYSTFVASLFGIVKGFVKKQKVLIALFPIFLMAVFMIMNMNPPFNYFFGWFRENISIFKEGLRTPYTKFSLLLMFVMAIYFGVFAEWLIRKSVRFIKSMSFVSLLAAIIIGGSLVFYGLPMFQGELISNRMLNEIPEEYFEFYKWAETQPTQTRFALLPVNSFVGWEFYKWGYQGAGFMWFGMSQPLLTRDFDRWSPYNETFYNQISTAVYGNDKEQFVDTLKKYDVSYLVLDESFIDPNQGIQDILRLDELKETILSLDIKETWQKDFLHVYDVRQLTGNRSFLYSPKQYSSVESDSIYARRDVAYQNSGNYVDLSNQGVIYPFSFLLKTQTKNVTYEENKVTIAGEINENLSRYNLVIPPIASGSMYTTSVTVNYQANILHVKFGSNSVIKLGDEDIALSQLPDLSINTGASFTSVYVNIGDRQVIVNNGVTEQIETYFEVNQPITIEYFDSDKVAEVDGQSYIPFAFMHKTTIDSTVWDKLTKEQRYQINGHIVEEISLTSEASVLTPNLKESTPNNCDINKRGTMSKDIEDDKIVLKSDERGVVCDGTTLVDLNQRYSYLLRWQTENLTGRGIKFYLHNLTSDKNDIEELLSGNQVDATYSVLSWPNLLGGGYYLSFENRSFGQPSSNIIENVEVYKLPLDLISKIKLEPQNYSAKINNQVKLTGSWKFATYKYGADVNASNDSGVIVLSQGFDKGWVAFKGSVLNFSSLKHVKYNGWANAWILPSGQYKVTIIYWPQFLEFIGFFILGVGLFMVWPARKRVKSFGNEQVSVVKQPVQEIKHPFNSMPVVNLVEPPDSHVIYDSSITWLCT